MGWFLQLDPIPPRPDIMNRYVYAACNPVNHSDAYGLDPYQMFLSRDAAARDFNSYVRTAFNPRVEHGGIIRQSGSLYYYDDRIAHGNERTVNIEWEIQNNEAAIVHTHTGDYFLSDDRDVIGAEDAGLDIYAGLPNGTLLLYEFGTDGYT